VTGAVGSVTGAVGSVTGAVGSVAGNVDGNVTGTVGSVVGAVGSVVGHTAQTGDSYDLLNTASTEPGQGAPGVSVNVLAKLGYLYKAWRNKTEQTATLYSLYNDAGSTVDQKATVSDDATTATIEEVVTGP